MSDSRNYINENKIIAYMHYDDLMGSNSPEIQRYKDIIFTKRLSSKYIGKVVSYRTLTHWTDLGIIDDTREIEGGWRKFNFPELVWIFVVEKMRSFGIGHELILKTKQGIVDDQYYEFYIYKVLIEKISVNIKVFNDGFAILEDIYDQMYNDILTTDRHFLQINLNEIIKSFYPDKDLTKNDPMLYPVSLELGELLDRMQSGYYDEVTVKPHGGGTIHIETRKMFQKSEFGNINLREGLGFGSVEEFYENMSVSKKQRKESIIL